MQGRPVLVDTRSVAASEQLSRMRDEAGLAHVLLNARDGKRFFDNFRDRVYDVAFEKAGSTATAQAASRANPPIKIPKRRSTARSASESTS
jgi:preprotein translocase subunit SecA